MITEFVRQLKYILTITKPKHIYNAIKAPHHTTAVLKYHYRRVSEKAFVEFFAKQWGCSSEEIEAAYRDLTGNIKCWEEISESLSNYKNSYALQMPYQELSVLYVLTRLLKPEYIVETGYLLEFHPHIFCVPWKTIKRENCILLTCRQTLYCPARQVVGSSLNISEIDGHCTLAIQRNS